MVMLSTSPGPIRSVGRGGIATSVETAMPGAAGTVAAFSTSTSVNGYWPGFATAACRISVPVGPLDGRVAQPARLNAPAEIMTALRIEPLRRGTQILDIE